MADEHFFPGPGDFSSGFGGAAPFFGSSYAPLPPPPGLDAAAMMQGLGLAWAAADLQLPDSSAAAAAQFDSALSSLVSSPAHNDCGYSAGAGGDDVAIGDLIGRLGSICSAAAAAASASNSCYSTPLSSPPRGGPSPSAALAFRGGCYPGGAAALETAGAGAGRLSRVASSKSLGAGAGATTSPVLLETSPEMGGGVAEMLDDPAPPPAKGHGSAAAAARKRKASGKGKATSAATTAAANASPKRSKLAAGSGADVKADADADTATAPPEPEPAKDYIHVRARRGQATDSHSLAERVRRERISERMKMLQSLVPGCNKITGKALMLDEIINYVQSLQRQVEFLSMKLATMNPELDAETRYHTATAMLASSHPPAAAAFSSSSYAAAADLMPFVAAHPAQLDSCPGWEAPPQQDDLHSVVVRHNHNAAAVRGHDLYASPSPSPPGSGFRHGRQQQQGQQGAATGSHMKLEQP